MKRNIFPLFLLLISVVMSIVFYPLLPDQVPIHWNIAGEVDGYASKLFASIFSPLILGAMYVLFWILPKIDPRKENYQKFKGSYSIIIYAILTFLVIIQGTIITNGMGVTVHMDFIIFILIGLLFIVLGNYMQRVKSNYFVGIRTPWTLQNEEVWKKTHRLSSKLFVIAGMLFIISAFLPSGIRPFILIVTIVVIVVLPYFFSYWWFRSGKY
ncbi:SdpI family protein [Bacillus sp. 165]|uniref:SdpI family protein n=1 Tax=Bacillus sp. 165 TaxID=1529117 RepID=UPI001ADC7BF5|nr:SdpI family protein [Bacillus sp. 165]MBO9128831.1 SdpI family protein [Bacillus sp. 165]